MKQRFLQVGVIILAVSMLGGYVVYSQKSQQPGQIMPGSKAKQISTGVSQPAQGDAAPAASGTKTNPSPLIMGSSKYGVLSFTDQPVQNAGGSAQLLLPATNLSPIFLSGSKFATVIRPEPLQLSQTNVPVTNLPSRMLMPSSKLIVLTPMANPIVTTNNAAIK